MSCRGGFSLDEATRRSWYNPEEILETAGLRRGMTFVDVGCGDGFFSLLAAEFVGESGKVHAVDIDSSAIEWLKNKAVEKGFHNISAKVGTAEETTFCKNCADVVFYCMVLHDFRNLALVLRNAKAMIKPLGTLVNLDWKKQEMPFGPPTHIRFSIEQAKDFLAKAGFHVQSAKDAGQYHYVITARPLP